jgi:Tetracyclin repressor-like, C-terminal domain
VMAGIITALHHDADFAAEFRTRVVGPKLEAGKLAFERAKARGEVTADLDLDLFGPALAGIILHRSFVLGLPADEKTVTQVVDEIILPAATRS